jgi:hypothetical protein
VRDGDDKPMVFRDPDVAAECAARLNEESKARASEGEL